METLSVIESRLVGLVHASAQDDPGERARHERFIVSRMATGAVALAGLPGYLLWRGVPSALEYVAILCLVTPLLAAVLLSRTGRFALAHGLASAALTLLVVCLAASSGALAAAAAIWLVAVPIEAMLSGSRRATTVATVLACLGAALVAGLDGGGALPPSEAWPASVALPVFALTALAHLAAQVLLHARAETQRRADATARDAQDRSLLQAIDDLVTWHDRNGHVLKASPAAAKLLGVPAGTLRGRGLFARVHVSDRPTFLKAISDAAVSGRPVVAQFRLHLGRASGDGDGDGDGGAPRQDPSRAGSGRVVWVEMRAHRVEAGRAGSDADLGGGYAAVVAVTRDVSAHKRHAEDLEEARSRAEQADLSKGRFLATVSHELRTPLNAIIGFSEILGSDAIAIDAARRREYAHIIRDSGTHLLDVVNTLLDMSKIETGNFAFEPEPFDLALLAHGCCDLMELKAEQGSLMLAREVAGDLPEIVADRRACRQVLINLLSNAVKFTPRGGKITVRVRREDDRMLLAVTDTGVGIAEPDLARVGDPFFQAGSVYSRPHEGTGLGLSVVRGLVGLHRGALHIESAPGDGTSVTVSLPLDCRTGAPKGSGGTVVPIQARCSPKRGDNVTALRTA